MLGGVSLLYLGLYPGFTISVLNLKRQLFYLLVNFTYWISSKIIQSHARIVRFILQIKFTKVEKLILSEKLINYSRIREE